MSERYEWLDERIDELIDRYESGQSLSEIADVFDVTPPTIHRRLKERDVAMRNGGPPHVRLTDRTDELVAQYVNDKASLQALADRYDTSITTIRFHLNAAGIDCEGRDHKTADVDLRPFQRAVIHGELLGDGCLHRSAPDTCFFQLSTTTRTHAERLLAKLPDGLFPESQPSSFTRPQQHTDGEYTLWTIRSRPQALFDRWYDDWYEIRTENNRKIVPDDFDLNRTALIHWYWGDGSCSIRDRGAPRVAFATHGFPESSVTHLQAELERLGYDNYAIEQQGVDDGSGLYIRLRDYDARTFLEDMRRANTLPQYDRKFPVPVEEGESET